MITAVFGFLSALMGLRTLIAIAGGIGLVAAFMYGHNLGDKQCVAAVKLAEAQARIRVLEHERNAAEELNKLQSEQEGRNLAEMSADDERIKELEAAIAKRGGNPDDDCPVAATEEEMRAIERIK
jgi:hypothetical protein